MSRICNKNSNFLKRFQKIPPERVEERDSVQKRKKIDYSAYSLLQPLSLAAQGTISRAKKIQRKRVEERKRDRW